MLRITLNHTPPCSLLLGLAVAVIAVPAVIGGERDRKTAKTSKTATARTRGRFLSLGNESTHSCLSEDGASNTPTTCTIDAGGAICPRPENHHCTTYARQVLLHTAFWRHVHQSPLRTHGRFGGLLSFEQTYLVAATHARRVPLKVIFAKGYTIREAG